MRDFGKVFTRIWANAEFRALSEDGRMLALYLLTSPHATLIGAFRLPDGYVCEDLQWSSARVAKGFEELLANGFATRCLATKWVWVRRYLANNPLENPNQRKSAQKLWEQVPKNCQWRQAFSAECGQCFGVLEEPENEPLANPFATVPQPGAGAGEGITPIAPKGDGLFEEFWSAYPKRVGKDAAKKAFERRKPTRQLLDAMLPAIEASKLSPQWIKDGGQYIPNPATWINQGRWQDDVAQVHQVLTEMEVL